MVLRHGPDAFFIERRKFLVILLTIRVIFEKKKRDKIL